MKWLNLEIKDLISHEYLGSEPVERSTWIGLLRYCCQQENNGTIKDCTEWGDRKWMQLVGITKEEALKKSMLWEVTENDIIVWHYPKEQQKVIKAKRLAGKRYGKGHPKHTYSTPNSSAKGNSNSKRKSKDNIKNEEYKPFKLRLNALFNRRENTEWSDKENQKFKDLVKRKEFETELSEIERLYQSGYEYKRKNMETLFNNWTGELDKTKSILKPNTPSNWSDSII